MRTTLEIRCLKAQFLHIAPDSLGQMKGATVELYSREQRHQCRPQLWSFSAGVNRRLAARVNWPPNVGVDWPPNWLPRFTFTFTINVLLYYIGIVDISHRRKKKQRY